ncbi:MAG TPA: hypothetical protein PLX07_11890, partial [Microthrixaceae bacterium]|nr:hypothetical protein [Microthrixaceae bacterium]
MAVPLPPPLNRLRAQVGAAIPSWEEVLERAGRVADEADHLNRVGARPEDGPPPPGMTASAWAVLKAS